MSKVVSFINYKGGVGKTTLAVEIAASLAYHYGKKVLLVDADPQTNATLYLINENEWEKWQENKGTMKDIFESFINNKKIDIKELIITEMEISKITDKLHLLPSHLDLYHIDLDLASKYGSQGIRARSILRKALEGIKNDYDFIIVDCPPNLNLVTQNGLIASDGYVIVLKPEYLSTLGVALIIRVVEKIINEINDELMSYGQGGMFQGPKLKGIIFNFIKYKTGPTKYQQTFIDKIRVEYPNLVFDRYLSESLRVAEKSEEKIPTAVSKYAPDRDYQGQLREIADEFLKRV